MKKKTVLILCSLTIMLSCGSDKKPEKVKVKTQVIKKEEPKPYIDKAAHFKTVPGKWVLMYPSKYGYSFYFSKNFKSVIILYLKNSALVFKGVYTFEQGQLKINVYEMKNSGITSYINLYRNFTKVKSSLFIFKSTIRTYNNKKLKQMILNPVRITIDSKTSDGYFEPVIKLKKV